MTLKLMIVDDHAVVRDGLQRLLETDAGFGVTASVGTGHGALEAANTCEPDIVLMDISLPDMDGIAVTEILSRRSPNTKIVMLTMHTDEELACKAFGAGAHAYIPKNATFEELARTLRIVAAGGLVIGAGLHNKLGEELVRRRTRRQAEPSLTKREVEVLRLGAEGRSNKEIAEALYVSVGTVKVHIRTICGKIGASNRTQMVMKATRLGLLT
ncbi:MAG: response regulator transcription factor [Bacillota bacterium]|nr:response regulator transcription factor [Bacillota bacterium]